MQLLPNVLVKPPPLPIGGWNHFWYALLLPRTVPKTLYAGRDQPCRPCCAAEAAAILLSIDCVCLTGLHSAILMCAGGAVP